MSQPRILVTGATGTNGAALLAALSDRGVQARAFVHDRAKAEPIAARGFEVAFGDFADRASLDRALQGIEKLYLLSAIRPDTVALFENAFASAEAAGVRHVVKFSGLGADPDSPSEVIRQHGASDAALIASGLDYTILRPNSFHQNMLWQAEAIRRDRRFYLPLGDARQSTVDVRDLAEATAHILTAPGHEGNSYDLTGPESLGFADVAEILGDVVGARVEYVPVPVEAAEAAMRAAGMPAWDAHVLAEIQALFATGAYAEVKSDLPKLLGRAPRSFMDFARDHAEVFR
jgi:uncharacterized protein YbjT (DUF2867 family)